MIDIGKADMQFQWRHEFNNRVTFEGSTIALNQLHKGLNKKQE